VTFFFSPADVKVLVDPRIPPDCLGYVEDDHIALIRLSDPPVKLGTVLPLKDPPHVPCPICSTSMDPVPSTGWACPRRCDPRDDYCMTSERVEELKREGLELRKKSDEIVASARSKKE
jgi:hypothetical protein